MSDETVHIELEHLKRVRLEPGDALVLQHPVYISNAEAGRLYQYLSRKFPGHEVLVISAGAQLGVVRPVADGESVPDNSPEAVVARYRAAGGLERP